MINSESDIQLAQRLAHDAGEILLGLHSAGLITGKELGKLGDARANALLMRELRVARPQDAILCEEEKDSPARLSHQRVWIIDPLDGTREYGEGRRDWAVHVGLSVDGVATLGAVALPPLGITMLSSNPVRLKAVNQPPRMLVSRTRPAKEALDVAKALNAALVPMGSAGAKAMAVLRGEAEIYLHTGGQYEWDNCAPVAVAAAHGLHVSRIDGGPMVYNQADAYMPDLLICRQELLPAVRAALAAL